MALSGTDVMREHRGARWRPVGLVVLATTLLVAAGCGSSSDGDKPDAKRSESARGKITVAYDEPSDQDAAAAKELLMLGGTDGVAAGFTKSFKLPANLKVHVVNGLVGPNYNPQAKTLTLSYGFVEYTAAVLKRNFPQLRTDDSEFGKELAAVDAFILVHEFGHAFIDLFDIPVLGKEEDAADAIAAVFLTRAVKGGAEYAFDAAKFFDALSGRQRTLAPSDYWDSHSLDKQRAYSIVCWIAGSSEAAFNEVAKLGVLGKDRLQSCPAEYRQKVRSVEGALRKHARG